MHINTGLMKMADALYLKEFFFSILPLDPEDIDKDKVELFDTACLELKITNTYDFRMLSSI